jgi:CheY-specific phosphatase CheX
LQRTISKINYRIHTDAVKVHIIPPTVTKEQASYVYASEADMLNVALFGKTAAQWRKQNPSKDGNMRDDATIEQLIVLSNMESINALLIKQGMPQGERLVQLNQVAITQMTSLVNNHHIKQLANTAEAKKNQ